MSFAVPDDTQQTRILHRLFHDVFADLIPKEQHAEAEAKLHEAFKDLQWRAISRATWNERCAALAPYCTLAPFPLTPEDA
jgi:hypothetical protein